MAGVKYSWVILFAAFMAKFLGPCLPYVAGVFHIALVEEYGDAMFVVWIGSIFSCMFALSGPIGSAVINCIGCRSGVILAGFLEIVGFTLSFFFHDLRLLCLSFSVIVGLGTGLAQSGAAMVVAYHFSEMPAVATGIIQCGTGIGSFLLPILSQMFLDWYGLRGAFLLMGAMTFHLCLSGMLMRPSKYEMSRKRKTDSIGKRTVSSLAREFHTFGKLSRNISFYLYALSNFTFTLAMSTLFLFLPDFYHKHGASVQGASVAIAVAGIGQTFGSLVSGFAANDQNIGPDLLNVSSPSILAALTFSLFSLTTSHPGRLVYGVLAGLYIVPVAVMINPIVLDILGLDSFATGVGVVSLSGGLGSLVGPPMAGAIFRASADYYSIIVFSGTMFFATSCAAVASVLTRRQTSASDAPLSKSLKLGRHEEKVLNVEPAERQPLRTDSEIGRVNEDVIT